MTLVEVVNFDLSNISIVTGAAFSNFEITVQTLVFCSRIVNSFNTCKITCRRNVVKYSQIQLHISDF